MWQWLLHRGTDDSGAPLLYGATNAHAQQSQYPMMDKIAQKVLQKYQQSSCQDLATQK